MAQYITGMSALNLPDPVTGETADWHPNYSGRLESLTIHGINFTGAAVLGDEGLYDCTETLRRYGFDVDQATAATHLRAIVDLLYFHIVVRERPTSIVDRIIELDDLLIDVDTTALADMLTRAFAGQPTERLEVLDSWRRTNGVP